MPALVRPGAPPAEAAGPSPRSRFPANPKGLRREGDKPGVLHVSIPWECCWPWHRDELRPKIPPHFLSILVCGRCPCPWNGMGFRVLPNPKHSMRIPGREALGSGRVKAQQPPSLRNKDGFGKRRKWGFPKCLGCSGEGRESSSREMPQDKTCGDPKHPDIPSPPWHLPIHGIPFSSGSREAAAAGLSSGQVHRSQSSSCTDPGALG